MSQNKHIFNIPNLFVEHGINQVIICAGSRSAPLTLAFTRNNKINSTVVFDERSAGYIALGMALCLQKPVVIICTSGTAVANLNPAVCEAYYQKVPLIILTADRPPEWIGQGDGQTINQNNFFYPNIKKYYQLPVDSIHTDSEWAVGRMINESILISNSGAKGPVHVNIPMREPLYHSLNESAINYRPVKVFDTEIQLSKSGWDQVISLLLEHRKIAIIAGQLSPDPQFKTILRSFLERNNIPLVADINSNLQDLPNAIINNDIIFGKHGSEILPDVIITIGNHILSKNIKKYFRANPTKVQLKITDSDEIEDTFKGITHHLVMSPKLFFTELLNKVKLNVDSNFLLNFQKLDAEVESRKTNFFKSGNFGEFDVFKCVLENIPDQSILHFSNSLSVRYGSLIGSKNTINYCNRGTSGIDGCTSTAMGMSMLTDKFVTLITGDMSFFYDRNAFWLENTPSNIRIILLNNSGGAIFGTLPDASKQPELNRFFVTQQKYSALHLAKEYGIEYTQISDLKGLAAKLKNFYTPSKALKIIEFKCENSEAIARLNSYIESAKS
ncbi:MAG: 2-succinyl-5-enolpyruvyl-6-hydroxy-3-cyclohexene-1-carboxylic-acid synthase [Bacteroidota bacterium]|nr:2-succinyl-5-enolpyruvyl-6-hydroxy-3-cyclohexene-1-carboxylic-acid synthase [Bacteroidota bacterium]